MARLTETEKQELLHDAGSSSRREDFARLEQLLVTLPPHEYLAFLTSASQLTTEKKSDRPPIAGNRFLL